MKSNKGITLIALVVTIIVLLILAGVALSLVLGENGIIKRSKDAVEKYNQASQNEQSHMNEVENWLENNIGTGGENEETKTIVDLINEGTVKVGDYIAYTVPNQGYTMTTAETGYTSDQPYNTGDYTGKWKVLYVDTNKIEIISEGSVGDLWLAGKSGYNNLISTLNTMSSHYINTSYASLARSVGSNRNKPEGTSELYTNSEYSYVAQYANDLIKDDNDYIEDITAMENANTKTTGENYRLASRRIDSDPDYTYVYCRHVSIGGTVLGYDGTYYGLWRVSDWHTGSGSNSRGIRPVITLKPNIQIDTQNSNGTATSPWIIK